MCNLNKQLEEKMKAEEEEELQTIKSLTLNRTKLCDITECAFCVRVCGTFAPAAYTPASICLLQTKQTAFSLLNSMIPIFI